MSRYAMIMAGGSGKRLWPMSRTGQPKQLLPLIGGRSLLELAWDRLEGLIPPTSRLICTGEAHRATVHERIEGLTDEQILGEPQGMDTLNAIALTAVVLRQRDPEAIFAVLTSDHLITPEEEFRATLARGFTLAENDPQRLITFTITPTFAAEQLGWVQRSSRLEEVEGAFRVARFHEKPEKCLAEEYLASGEWGWNSGMFIFSATGFLAALHRFHPVNYEAILRIGAAWDTPDRKTVLQEIYPSLHRRSVDYVVMSPASQDPDFEMCTLLMDVAWKDIGSWPGYEETLEEDGHANRANARVRHEDSHRILAISDDPEHLIATIGCDDLVIVHTREATLVCPRDRLESLKEFVEGLDERDQ